MKRVSTFLTAFLFLGIMGCARKQKDDFAKELLRNVPIGTSQGDAEKVLDQYGFTHSADLKTHTIYAIKRGQMSGSIRQDWSVKINLGEGQRVDSLVVEKVFIGP